VIARNLLGRLNYRTPDDLQRIAAFWQVPMPSGDRGRQIGALYRAMTDVRFARDVWDRLVEPDREIVRELALRELAGSTVEEIGEFTGLRPSVVREAAIRLFHGGVLAREGDTQELPIGALPRLFLPREVSGMFRRVQDEIDAGDLSGNSLRIILETRDDPEIEEAAAAWGVRIIPGQRRRSELIQQIVRQVDAADRVATVSSTKSPLAAAIWTLARDAEPEAVPLGHAIDLASQRSTTPLSRDPIRAGTAIRSALAELESALLVVHSYRRDGSRWLFVPHEVAHAGQSARTLPLRPVQPLPMGEVTPAPGVSPNAIAWDLLTLLRDISTHGAPLWVPGEPVSRTWQRRLNRRLWFGGNDIPPTGYLGFLLYLATSVGVLTASDQPLPPGSDRHAIRLIPTREVRSWTRLAFANQMSRLREAWTTSDIWLEGREREEIDVWGADWPGLRHRLVESIATLDPKQWIAVSGLAGRLAEQQPDILGGTFTAASARATPSGIDERTASISQVIEIELETALSWFGVVESGRAKQAGSAVRPSEATPLDRSKGNNESTVSVSEDGEITLHVPAPIHIWSLTAFADAEDLRPSATYHLRQPSVGRALGNGFDLNQIVAYLEQQSGNPLPATVRRKLQDWTVGYRRVRLQRAVILAPDTREQLDDLRNAIVAAGIEVVSPTNDDGTIVALVPAGTDGQSPEDTLLSALRASGFAGQWAAPGPGESGRAR